MDPDVCTPNTHTIQATSVTTVDDEIVHLAVRAGVHGEVECRGVNQSYIVETEVCDLRESVS